MKKHINKFLLTISSLALFASLAACNKGNSQGTYQLSGDVVSDVTNDSDAFSNSDTKEVEVEEANATITLSGSTGTISDTTCGSSGSIVTITKKGTYHVTGSSTNVEIIVNETTKSGNIYLLLDNVTMNNSSNACIKINSADKVIIKLIGDNVLTSTVTTAPTEDDKSIDGTIFARDDLTINGEGKLTVNSKLHGIVAKDDFKLTGGELIVNADGKGIDANDSVRIGDGKATIVSGKDGVHVENDAFDGYFYMEGGELNITSGQDGIDVGSDETTSYTGDVIIPGGTIDIVAGGGSSKSKNSSTSQKGIKSDGDIQIGNATITVSSADDAYHSAATISITDGVHVLSSSDDGIHADSTLSISGGNINVKKSYEGLEAYVVDVSGGDVSVVSSDDGINAAGGSDTTSTDSRPGGWGSSSSTGTLKISGGEIYINAQGDGLDSNGSMYISGGTTIVEGPTGNGNGALDKGDGNGYVASITGGTVLAIGSSGMAINFDAGSQCSGLVSLSGSNGTKISVDDGSGFSFTATKSFQTAVYSSPYMKKGNSYVISAGSSSVTMSFTSSYYYSNAGGGAGGPGGGRPR